MFNQVFVSYLTEKDTLNAAQAAEILEIQKSTRLRIGVLAEVEGLMTTKQVDIVNRAQASKNARFGDIAVSKGFLTQEQVEALLKKQPQEHIILKQIVTDKNILTAEQFDTEIEAYKTHLGISDEEYTKLQCNNIPTYVKHIVGIDETDILSTHFATLFISTTLRLIDREIIVKKAYDADFEAIEYAATQGCYGDENHQLVFAAAEKDFARKFAEAYARHTFSAFYPDARDALMEYLNCVNGLVISELSNNKIMELDIEVPEYHAELEVFSQVQVIPFTLSFGDYYVFII